MPRSMASPEVCRSCPVMILIVVVFPAPDGPRKPRISPWCRVMLMSFSACSVLNRLEMWDRESNTFCSIKCPSFFVFSFRCNCSDILHRNYRHLTTTIRSHVKICLNGTGRCLNRIRFPP